MKNILAFFVGCSSSFFLFFFIMIYALPNYDIELSKQFLPENFDYCTFDKIINVQIFVIYPIVFIVSGFIEALIAKKNEYLIGLLSSIPFIFMAFYNSINFIIDIFVIFLSVSAGVFVSKNIIHAAKPKRD